MKHSRPRAMMAAAALTALTACSGRDAAVEQAAQADVDNAFFIACTETPNLVFAGVTPGFACNLSGAARLITQDQMIVAVGPGRLADEPLRLLVGVAADDGQRFCVAQVSAVSNDRGTGYGALYTVIDSAAKLQANRTGIPMPVVPAIEDENALPEDLSCRVGLEARARLALQKTLNALEPREPGTPA